MGYLKNVAKEMKAVTWPSAHDVNRFTWIVILCIVAFGLYFSLADGASGAVIQWLVNLI